MSRARCSACGADRTRAFIQGKHRHGLNQLSRLDAQTLSGCRTFLHQGGILLRHLVHLRDSHPDLVNTGTLFLACRTDFSDDDADLLDGVDDFIVTKK